MRTHLTVLALALAGCSTGGGAPDMPGYFLDAGFEIGMAQTTADVCTSVRYREDAANTRQQAVAERFIAEGRRPDELEDWLSSPEYEAWADERTRTYLAAKGIDPDISLGAAEEDACRIAEEEIAAGSGIGQLLEKV